MGLHRETGNLFQLIQQRHLLEGGLHGKVQLRHAAGEIQLDSGRFGLSRIFLANGGGNAGAIGSPQINIQRGADADGIQRVPRTVFIDRQ